MNYLAHFFLSYDDESLIVGNFIADDVKGNKYLNFPEEIQKGILLHRAIDSFTDGHELVWSSKNRIRTHQQKFTPVVIDVFYDYFLAINWKKYSDSLLFDYSQHIYKILHRNRRVLPEKSGLRLNYMEKYNWLYHYSKIEGIKKTLIALSNRSLYENNMNNAHLMLVKEEKGLEEDFKLFFPELIHFVKTKKNNL